MSLQAIYDAARQGEWQEVNPSHCGCKGYGWYLSGVDTWHHCSLHGKNVPHPEMDVEFEWESHFRQMNIKAFRMFRGFCRQDGWRGTDAKFILECRKYLKTPTPVPADWVNAAEALCESIPDERAIARELWHQELQDAHREDF